jgi:hypothetical protein
VLGHRAPDPRWNEWLEMTTHHHGQEQESA